jgi:hypothetical protein
VCSIYDDDDDDDEATRESPETRGRGLCRYLGFSFQKEEIPNERKQQKNDSKRESAERERDRRRRRRRIKRE